MENKVLSDKNSYIKVDDGKGLLLRFIFPFSILLMLTCFILTLFLPFVRIKSSDIDIVATGIYLMSPAGRAEIVGLFGRSWTEIMLISAFAIVCFLTAVAILNFFMLIFKGGECSEFTLKYSLISSVLIFVAYMFLVIHAGIIGEDCILSIILVIFSALIVAFNIVMMVLLKKQEELPDSIFSRLVEKIKKIK